MTPLEDNFADILGKAMRGLGLTEADAADTAGLSADEVRSLLDGEFDETTMRAVAPALNLDVSALARIARNAYSPVVDPPPWLDCVTTIFNGMTVNAYIVWDLDSRKAAIFDTGADARPLVEVVKRKNLEVVAIFLTHSHADHIGALGQLQKALDVEAWSSELEPVRGTNYFRPGDLFNAGRHFIRTRLTCGHSPGGTTFLIEGQIVKVAIVGDALFAGSIGGVHGNYASTLDQIRGEIFSLPDDTIICPGHGPMSTVGQERTGNPFFA